MRIPGDPEPLSDSTSHCPGGIYHQRRAENQGHCGGQNRGAGHTDTLDLTRTHLVPVLGLYADYETTVHLELLNSRDEVVKENTLTIETDVLPEYLRTAVNVEKAGEPTSMDLMLVSGLSTPYVYAFDSAGEIRWYCSLEREYYGAFPLENGHILIESRMSFTPIPVCPIPRRCWRWIIWEGFFISTISQKASITR